MIRISRSKAEFEIPQEAWPYPPAVLKKWKSGDLSLLEGLPDFLSNFFSQKAASRPGRRFFGEAWVIKKLLHEADRPWFNSFKWLTAKAWRTGKFSPEQRIESLFCHDLVECLGKDRLRLAQENAAEYCRRHPDRTKPHPPDVVLLNKAPKKSKFIEVKLPGDSLHDGQLEGLTIISQCLLAEVSIVWLYPEGGKRPEIEGIQPLSSTPRKSQLG